jgi:hypothetical protein
MTESIEVGDLRVTPHDRDYKLIHPAIGTVDGIAYMGVWYPCDIRDSKGRVTMKDCLFLVTGDRRKILANDSILRNYGWRLEYRPTRYKNRWNLDLVEAYLNGATVNPVEVLKNLVDVYKRQVEFSDERDYYYHPLWDIGTYIHFLFSTFPYNYHGGVKKTGKTKALTLHWLLAFNAIFSNNMSISSIYRLIQNARCTLLLDETERLSQRQMSERTMEFRSILLSGYKRGGQAVYRTDKDKDEQLNTRPYEVYGPKALANIQGLEDVIEDRCKLTIHRRSINRAILNVDPDIENPEWDLLRSQLYILFLTYWQQIKACYDSLDTEQLDMLIKGSNYPDRSLDGRDFELWRPILALALFFDGFQVSVKTRSLSSLCSLCSLMLNQALEQSEERNVENLTETGESILVQVLLGTVTIENYYSVKKLRDNMLEQYDEKPQWITTRWIGSALKRLGFKDKHRVGTGYQYKFNPIDVKELAERMGIREAQQKLGELSELSEGSEHVSEPLWKTDTLQPIPLTVGEVEPGNPSPRTEENLVAAHCKKWHTGACTFPGDPNCITPLNTCPKTCPDYEEDGKK